MTSATIAIDGLWHCLCPSFSLGTLAKASRISRPINALFRQCSTSSTATRQQIYGGQRPHHPQIQSSLNKQLANIDNARCLHDWSDERYKPLGKSRLDGLTTRQAYEELRRASIHGDYLTVEKLVQILVRNHREEPNSRLYHALLLANTNPENGSLADVTRLLQEMADNGIPLDSAAYHAILKVLAIHPDYLLRQDILEELRQKWFTLSNDGWHDLVVGLIRDRQLELAIDTLEQMQNDGVKIQSWLRDMVIYTLCDVEEFDEALAMMRSRVSRGELSISATLWYYLLDTASRALHEPLTLYAWRHRVETRYLNPSTGICLNVLSTAARNGSYRLATDVFRILGSRNHTMAIHHYECLLESYLAASDLASAFAVLSVMVSSDCPPTEATARPIFIYLCESPDLPAFALTILRDFQKSQRVIPTPAVNCIIEAFIHHKDLTSAIETYKSLHTICPNGPTTATFNTLFRGCSKSARKDQAMFLASEMVALKVPPDALTYDRLMLVCLNTLDTVEGTKLEYAREGIDDAWRYFEEMKATGWWPRGGTLVKIAKKCCEVGDEKVWALLEEMRERGIDYAKMTRMVKDNWRGGEDAARAFETDAPEE